MFCSASWRAVSITSSISGASCTVCGVELKFPGFDLRQIEYLIDEAKEMSPGAVHALQRLLRLFGPETRRIGDHHLGQTDDGVERRAKLVAHAGDKLRLVLAR